MVKEKQMSVTRILDQFSPALGFALGGPILPFIGDYHSQKHLTPDQAFRSGKLEIRSKTTAIRQVWKSGGSLNILVIGKFWI